MPIRAKREVERHLSADQVADRLSVDHSTVWRWIRTGKLHPVVKLGRRVVRVPESAVVRMLEQSSL
jgi:excisionase family DNA binding protein